MRSITILPAILFVCLLVTAPALAHNDEHDPDVTIHTFENGETWTQCSFMIHPTLTQGQFHRFTREAGDIVYFQPLTGAKPLGKYNFNLSLAMSKTPIDQASGAWNNTFAHPVTDTLERPHYLGDQVSLPNIRFAIGLTDHLDVGVYATKNFGANYGFYGLYTQYGRQISEKHGLYLAGRLSHTRLFGPADMKLHTTAADVLFSKQWKWFEPYAGLSLSFNRGRETTDKVDLHTENILSPRAVIGIRVDYKFASAALEYNRASVNTLALRVGVEF